MKNKQVAGIIRWTDMMAKYASSRCTLSRVTSKHDLGTELSKMTRAQLECVAGLIAAAHHLGCESTREHIKSLRDDANRWNAAQTSIESVPAELILSRKGIFSVIQGGAA